MKTTRSYPDGFEVVERADVDWRLVEALHQLGADDEALLRLARVCAENGSLADIERALEKVWYQQVAGRNVE